MNAMPAHEDCGWKHRETGWLTHLTFKHPPSVSVSCHVTHVCRIAVHQVDRDVELKRWKRIVRQDTCEIVRQGLGYVEISNWTDTPIDSPCRNKIKDEDEFLPFVHTSGSACLQSTMCTAANDLFGAARTSNQAWENECVIAARMRADKLMITFTCTSLSELPAKRGRTSLMLSRNYTPTAITLPSPRHLLTHQPWVREHYGCEAVACA